MKATARKFVLRANCSDPQLLISERRVEFASVFHCKWLEDPGIPLPPEIVELTGLTDADLAGRRLDDAAIMTLFADADLVVANNAQFDRGFIDVRFPSLARRPWVCSLADIDWRQLGFEGRALNALLMQCGLFQPAAAHRAGADVDALIGVLRTSLQEGGAIAGALIAAAQKPTLQIEATGAHYDARLALRARNYRWNRDQRCKRVWMKHIPIERRDEELA